MPPRPDAVEIPDAVELIEKTTAYAGYFRVDRYRLRHELFAGGWSQEITREVCERGHAVAVLPYDPKQDAVVLIEQFRIGPFARAAGDSPWLLEIVAGIIEGDEHREDVARREAAEEAGLTIGELVPVVAYYPSPGAVSEHIEIYCGRVECSGAGGIHGLSREGEDIRVRVLPFAAAMAELAAGRVKASHAVIALQWLALNREEIRRLWS